MDKVELIVLQFCLGLTVGLALCLAQHFYIRRRLHNLLGLLRPESTSSAFNLNSRLISAITQQQQSYRRVQTAMADLRYLLDRSPIAYLQVDRDNQLRWCNTTAQELLKIESDSFKKPRLLLEFIRSYDLDRLIEETRQQQVPQQLEWGLNLIGPDPVNPSPRATLYLLGHSFPLPNGEVGVFLEDRQELVNLMQQRDRWVSDVAHELKTPLTSIRLVAETVLNRVDPQFKSWIERLLHEVVHLSNMVQDLLDISQLEQRSPHSLSLTQVDIVDLIYGAWETLEPLARQRDMYLTYSGPDKLTIEGDPSRLYRVILNLLDNATKYSPAGQEIQVILDYLPISSDLASPLQQSASQIYLDIIDNGPGFPEQALNQVFERFYRVDPARHRMNASLYVISSDEATNSTQEYSSGLGLAIVKQIVTAHHGMIQARNHPETGGAWLRVCLPLKQKN